MISCGRRNIRKHRGIKNGDKYITFKDVSEIFSLEKKEFTYSESNNYMRRLGEGLITSLDLSTPKNKQETKDKV